MKKNKEKYFSNTVTFWKRVGSYVADLVFFLIISIFVYSLASYPIISSTTKLNEYYEIEKETFDECRNLLIDSNLLRLDEDDNEKQLKDIFKDNLIYFVNEDFYKEDGSGNYNDIYYYFFLNFAPTRLTHEENHVDYTLEKVNKELYKVDDSNNKIFTLNGSSYDKPLLLKEDAKIQLQDFLNTEINATSQQYFDDYCNIMNDIWSVASNYILTSNEYQNPAYRFNEAMNQYYLIHSVAVIITYVVCYSLYFIMVPLITKNRQTLAKKILRIGIFEEDFKPAKRNKILVRSLVQMIFTFAFALFIPLLQVGMGILYMPLFIINGNPFYFFTFCLIIFVMFIIDAIYMSINMNHRAIEDKLLKVLVIKDSPEFLTNTSSNEEEKIENSEDGSEVQ